MSLAGITWAWGPAASRLAAECAAILKTGGLPNAEQWQNYCAAKLAISAWLVPSAPSETPILSSVFDHERQVLHVDCPKLVQVTSEPGLSLSLEPSTAGAALMLETFRLYWRAAGSPTVEPQKPETGLAWAAAVAIIGVGAAVVAGLSYCTVQALPVIDRQLHRNATAKMLAEADGHATELLGQAAAYEESTGEPHPMTDEIKEALDELRLRQDAFRKTLPEPAAAPGVGGAVLPIVAGVAIVGGLLLLSRKRERRAA